ncbi:MAG: tetratricopeptide repeat protein, partial [Planctomycetota bacterium]
ATDDLPKNLFTIAECLVKQGKHGAAISELSQIEGSGAFPREAPKAAWQIATIWQATGNRKLYVGALTTVIAKYPKSRESSTAHNALESMGLSHLIRGGKGAD